LRGGRSVDLIDGEKDQLLMKNVVEIEANFVDHILFKSEDFGEEGGFYFIVGHVMSCRWLYTESMNVALS
jgi:hypothetical protein